MLYLINSKNDNAKKNLDLTYSQENMTTYSPIIKGMARYLSTQYHNNKPAHQRDGKKGDKKKGMIRNLKTRIVTRAPLQVHMLKILQHLKNSPLLAEELVQALTFWRQMNSCFVHYVL